MSTRRERLERKLEKRSEWAGKADGRSSAAFDKAGKLADSIPFGQPILVGHHSERHARRDAERIHNGMARGVEEMKLAEHHRAKASGLEAQLASSIFSDDDNAVEALGAKVAKLELERDQMKAINAAFKKAGAPKPDDVDGWGKVAAAINVPLEELAGVRANMAKPYWDAKPFAGYALTNLGGRIRQAKERIAELERRATRTAAAELAGGVVIASSDIYCTVTFAEKPAREVLEALRSAGFAWGRGSWSGYLDKLPACVRELATPAEG